MSLWCCTDDTVGDVLCMQVKKWLLSGDMVTSEQRDHFLDVTMKV